MFSRHRLYSSTTASACTSVRSPGVRRCAGRSAVMARAPVSSSSYSSITMPTRQDGRPQRRRKTATEEQWAEFADDVLEIAREIQFRGYASPEAVSLTPSEGTVMRYLFRHAG